MTNSQSILGKWIEQKSYLLKKYLQKKLYNLQNPTDCGQQKLMICGQRNYALTGSQLHALQICLFSAYAFNRTFIFKNNEWHFFGIVGVDGFFQKINKNCPYENKNSQKFDFGTYKTHFITI